MSVVRLGWFGLVGVAYTVLAVLVLHVVDPDVGLVGGFMSEYSHGDYGWLMRSAFFAAGGATAVIAEGLRRSLPPSARSLAAVVLLALAAVGFVVAGIADSDLAGPTGEIEDTAAGIAHDTATFVLFLSIIVAAFLLRAPFAATPPWRAMAGPALWFGLAMLVSRVAMLALPDDGPVGLSQRLFTGILMAWLAVLGWALRRSGAR